jgi:hypothetical protein
MFKKGLQGARPPKRRTQALIGYDRRGTKVDYSSDATSGIFFSSRLASTFDAILNTTLLIGQS